MKPCQFLAQRLAIFVMCQFEPLAGAEMKTAKEDFLGCENSGAGDGTPEALRASDLVG